jgi:hypothetical protein
MVDPLIMDQLPKVLQKEIWEFVRGDRAYWKQQFSNVVAKVRSVVRISRPVKGYTVRLKNPILPHFDICLFDDDKCVDLLGYKDDLKSAVLEFKTWTEIVHQTFSELEIVKLDEGRLELEIILALYRAKDEWQARSDSC